MKAGIAVTTTPNREKVFAKFYESYAKRTPHIPLYVHNDCDYQGIAYSKNKCLEMLEKANASHFFLFDDDLLINSPDFIDRYVSSRLNHACWNYNRALVKCVHNTYTNTPYLIYEKPNGCMLYATRKVIETVGGWDTNFKGYGFDHVNWSDRIFNAGLTPARYIDIPKSSHLFSMQSCESSVSREIRAATIPANRKLYEANFNSKEFKPYK